MSATPIYLLFRWGGLGDVLMALAASKALKVLKRATVVIITQPAYQDLVRCCPHVDGVITSADDLKSLIRTPAMLERHAVEDWGSAIMVNLNPVSFGISPMHQVDAYLEHLGIKAAPSLKSLHVNLPAEAVDACDRVLGPDASARDATRVLLHAGTGDPNRSWPMDAWKALATRLAAEGCHIAFIGNDRDDPYRGAHPLDIPGAKNLVNQLSVLGLIALMRRSALLVSADSGPIQVAGATEIPIVGIYSVVAGAHRLPFRHGLPGWRASAVEPACPHFPCYAKTHDAETWRASAARFGVEIENAAEILPRWCLSSEPYHCMSGDAATVDRVFKACLGQLR